MIKLTKSELLDLLEFSKIKSNKNCINKFRKKINEHVSSYRVDNIIAFYSLEPIFWCSTNNKSCNCEKEIAPVIKESPSKKTRTLPSKLKYDFSLLGKFSDADLAKQWGLCKERIRQFRELEGVPKFSNKQNKEKEEKILNYLKELDLNKQPFILHVMFSKLKFKSINGSITISYVQDLANKHNIILHKKQVTKYEHGCHTYKKRCRCDICKLATKLSIYFLPVKCNMKKNTSIADMEANENIEMYKTNRKEFYKYLEYKYKQNTNQQ